MSNELFDQLEKKVTNALETIEMLRMEVEELREENQKLITARQQGESRLSAILSRFSQVEETPSSQSSHEHVQSTAEHHG